MHRSGPYLAHVRGFPCSYCKSPGTEDNPIVAHHHGRRLGRGGTSVKVSDYRTAPLCAWHHQDFHQDLRIADLSKEATDLLLFKGMAECLESWIVRTSGQVLDDLQAAAEDELEASGTD